MASDPEPDQRLLEAIKAEKKRADEEAAAKAEEEYQAARQKRPNWYTIQDLANDLLSKKPEGFLANDEGFMRGSVNLIFGPGGVYKTWLVLYILGQIARGLPIGGIPTRKGRVLFFSEEMTPDSIRKRICSMYFTEEERRAFEETIAIRFQQNLDFYATPKAAIMEMEMCIAETNDPEIIFMDAFSDIHSGDETSGKDMGIVMKALKTVALNANIPIIPIHHSGKPSEFRKGADRSRGHSIIQNKCGDMILIDQMSPRPDGRPRSKFEWVKHRDLSQPKYLEPFSFWLEPGPQDPESRIILFGESDDASATNIGRIREIAEDLCQGDEVSREALRIGVVDGEKWSVRRFEETLSAAVRQGVLKRRKSGKEVYFSL